LFPCIRCLIPKDDIFKIGTEEDKTIREEKRRTDGLVRQGRVNEARSNLYKKGYALTGDHVDKLLRHGSLVPTKVEWF
jgi:hypothetical protein